MTDELPAWMTEGVIKREPALEEKNEASEETTISPSVEIRSTEPHEEVMAGLHEAMQRDIRSWGKWLIGLGIFHLIAAGKLDASWGAMLILLGAVSFLFTSPSMYVVYAITMAWAGVTNLIDSGLGWSVFALFQFYLTFRIGQKYYFFRKAGLVEEELLAATSGEEKKPLAPRLFPWLGLISSAFLLVGLLALILTALVLYGYFEVSDDSLASMIWDFTFGAVVSLAVVFWGVNLSSILSRYRPRFLPWLGLFFSSVTLGLFLLILVLS